MMIQILKWMIFRYIKFSDFIYTNKIYKFVLILIWMIIPIIIYIAHSYSLHDYFYNVFIYEILWYTLMCFIIYGQSKLFTLISSRFNVKITILSSKWWVGFILLYLFITICCAADLINGLFFNTTYNLGFIYGNLYAIYLFVIRILLFAPAFVNVFIILTSFYFFTFESYKNILTPQEFIDAKEYAFTFNKGNKILYKGYLMFIILVPTAYTIKKYLNPIIINGIPNNIDISLFLHIAYIILPICIALIYHRSFMVNFTKIILDCFLKLKPDELEREKINKVYFDNSSPYCISSHLVQYLINTIIPVVLTAILTVILTS